jgi:hypothetical protein
MSQIWILGIAGPVLVSNKNKFKESREEVVWGQFEEPPVSDMHTGWAHNPNLGTWNHWPVLVSKSKFKESREEVILAVICRTYIFCHLYRLGTFEAGQSFYKNNASSRSPGRR